MANKSSNTKNNNSVDAKIAEQQRYFKLYVKLPLFIAMSIIELSLISCIIIVAVTKSILGCILCMVFGVLLATIEYFIGKILFSQKILTVLYLQKLNEDKQ